MKEKIKYKAFSLFLATEILLPACPIVLEFFMYHILRLSAFTLFEKSLIASATMVPLVAAVKSDISAQKWLFGSASALSAIMLVIVLFLTATNVTVDPITKNRALNICYGVSLFDFIFVIVSLIIINFALYIGGPWARNRRPTI